MTRSGSISLEQKYLQEDGAIYLTGIQALIRVLLDQQRSDARRGVRTAGFVSGYPGSPVGGVDLELARWRRILEAHHIVHQPGLNEDIAATSIFGAQTVNSLPGAKFDGVFGMWFGKAPGLDRTGDAFRHSNFRGVSRNGGVLAVVGDDPAPKSSILPSDSSATLYDLCMPVLSPGDVQDILDLGLHGYALSRASGLWVGLKLASNVADSASSVLVGHERIAPVVPRIEYGGVPFEPKLRINEAGKLMLEVERELYYARLEIARAYGRVNRLNRVVLDPGSARLGIAASGKCYFEVRQALEDLGLDESALRGLGIRILKLGLLFPIDAQTIREFAAGLEEIVVVEDKREFLELFIKDILYGTASAPRVLGKRDEAGAVLLPAHGELGADVIARALASRIRRLGAGETIDSRLRYLGHRAQQSAELPVARGNYFCSGCPHNRSLVVPEGSIVGAGIGCHIMALHIKHETFGTLVGFTHMGGEGAQWIGVAPFSETPHFFQNLGDGTFAHSGSLAVRAAVAAGVNVTYKLLYNSAVGMTGGQDVTGGMSVASLARSLEAEGVSRIVITTDDPGRYARVSLPAICEVMHRDRLVEAQNMLAQTKGVTLLVHDQQCAAEKRRLRKRNKLAEPAAAIFINERVCEGCGDCGHKSNCLSVQPAETEFGRKTQIHNSSCNKDYSCLMGDCPSFASVVPSEAAPRSKRRSPLPDITIPAPAPIVPGGDFAVHMAGIGGTGVVTVNQILGTAAIIEGKTVRALDQFGSSQKAGPVVSHLRIFDHARDVASAVPTGGADLYLVFDLLVGADPKNLVRADPKRSVAVVSTTHVPTGRMVADPQVVYPQESELRRRIESATRADASVWLDAQQAAEDLIGDHMAANMLLVGAAWQTGALPLSLGALEDAIRLNGVAVEANLAAFRWGRIAVVAPERLLAARTGEPGADTALAAPSAEAAAILGRVETSGELRRLLEIRVPELIAYQDAAYAADYVDFVGRILQAERRHAPGGDALSCAVAKYLFKLMAYKDEYEVARLLLDDAQRAKLAQKFGDRARVTWHLHPSFLRRLGRKEKVRLGPWFTPVLRLLRGLKWVRRRNWDPLRLDRMRRVERALIAHYREMIEAASGKLAEGFYDAATELAGLPEQVRGYDRVKLTSIQRYFERVAVLSSQIGIEIETPPILAEFASPPPETDATKKQLVAQWQ